jgi:NAD dependent epimerase/dehydratase
MNWNGKKVLITGAGGFIGSHLTESLVERGASVRAFVHYDSRGGLGNLVYAVPTVLRAIEVIAGDLRDLESVRRATAGVDTLFHLGALIAIPYSYLNPRSVVETNVIGTLNVLEAARDESVSRFIHASTSEVYGTARYTPMDEAHSLHGQSPYAASKIGADAMVEAFHRSFGLPVVTIRPFNTYGPRQSARAVIPSIIVQALRHDVVKLGSLAPKRDFTFVDDTVRGFMQAAEGTNLFGEDLNLGSGVAVSIGELVHYVLLETGGKLPVVLDPQRARPTGSEVMELVASNRKAEQLINWRPSVTLAEGLAITVAWFREHIESYRSDEYSI